MSALGVLPPVDLAIHSDTGWERKHTLDFAARWTPWLADHGVPVLTVHPKDGIGAFLENNSITLPAFTRRHDGTPSGMLRRQCTNAWKLRPIRHWLRPHKTSSQVQLWIGITCDEAKRMRESGVKYIQNHYPLIQRFYTRDMTIRFLNDAGLEVPPKSTCICCPFHTQAIWNQIRHVKEDWQRAVDVDQAIRTALSPKFLCYLHHTRKPLLQCNFSPQPPKPSFL